MSASAPDTSSDLSTDTGPLSDAELQRLRNRNPESVRRHIYGNRDYLRSVLRRYTDTAERARDLLQETFFQALRSLPDFRGDAKLSTWLYSIVKNVALAQYRKDKRHQYVDRETLTHVAEVTDAGDAPTGGHVSWGPAAQTTARERKALLHDALDELSDNYREVIELRDLKELSTQEVADRLGLTRVNVRVRLHRARKKLEEALDDSPASDLQPAG